MIESPSIFLAFGLGVLSFLSPCVLPIVPSFLGYISGVKLEQKDDNRLKIFYHTLLFTLGFSIILVILGASASKLGTLTLLNRPVLEKIAGILIIIIGLNIMGIFSFTLPSTSNKITTILDKLKFGRSFFTGIFFAFGWFPCISLILASIMALASIETTLVRGMTLLSFFAAGLSLSFIIAALLFDRFVDFSKYSQKIGLIIKYLSGVILIALGIFLVFSKFSLAVSSLYNIFSKIGINW